MKNFDYLNIHTHIHTKDPVGITVDSLGSVYVGDSGNYRIRLIQNGTVSTFCGTGIEAIVDGPLGVGELDSIAQIYFDPISESILVSQVTTNFLRIVNASGYITTVAGTGQSLPIKNGVAKTSTFNSPVAFIRDEISQDYFVAEENGNRVRRMTSKDIVFFFS